MSFIAGFLSNRHNLHLNVQKTKEIIIDFRRGDVNHTPLFIHEQAIEHVHEYKYLGTLIDDKLRFNKNTNAVHSRANQRMFFLRKLKKFNVDRTILHLFYQSIIQSVLLFNLICFYGNLTQADKTKLERPRKIAQRIIGIELPPLSVLFEDRLLTKITSIMKDPSHPLFSCFTFNRSGIRLRVPITRRARYRNSFIPNSMHIYNAQVTRNSQLQAK